MTQYRLGNNMITRRGKNPSTMSHSEVYPCGVFASVENIANRATLVSWILCLFDNRINASLKRGTSEDAVVEQKLSIWFSGKSQ
jgi:hypothetical protein